MSQDMIRQSHRGTTSVEDVWGNPPPSGNGLAYPSAGGGGTLGQPGGGNDVKPLQVVHRSLRGRYRAAILLAVICAVGGAALGWKLNEKVYRAAGLIRINSTVANPFGQEVTTEYGRYMKSEANSIRSQEIAERSMTNPAWQSVAGKRPADAGSKAAFLNGVKSVYDGISNDIVITYDDPNPKVAVAAIESILSAYSQFRDEQRSSAGEQSVGYYEKQRDQIREQIADYKRQESAVQRKSQGDVDQTSGLLGKTVMDYGNQLRQAKSTLQRMENLKERAVANGGTVDYLVLARPRPVLRTPLRDSKRSGDAAESTRNPVRAAGAASDTPAWRARFYR